MNYVEDRDAARKHWWEVTPEQRALDEFLSETADARQLAFLEGDVTRVWRIKLKEWNELWAT